MKFRESECLNAELSEMGASLDRRVLECTAEIERDHIQLIETEARRHTMMTNIFHDIRNPIFSIKGCLDMMRPENDNDIRLLEIIKRRLGELRELTENLFLSSRLEEREVIFSESAQDMSELCLVTVSPFVVAAQEKT
jgi:signal transduction histidine kinase